MKILRKIQVNLFLSLSCQQVNRLRRNKKVCTPYGKQYRRLGFHILFRFRKKAGRKQKKLLNVFMDGDALMLPKERRPPCQTLSRGQMNHNFRKHQEFSRPIQVLSVLLQPARIAGKKVCCQTCAFYRIFFNMMTLSIFTAQNLFVKSVYHTQGVLSRVFYIWLWRNSFFRWYFSRKNGPYTQSAFLGLIYSSYGFLLQIIAKARAPFQWKYPLSKPVCFLYLL